MNSKKRILELKEKVSPIDEFLIGYWENDVWNIENIEMKKFIKRELSTVIKKIDFSALPLLVRKEVKYYFAYHLKEDTLSIQTVLQYGTLLNHLAIFLNKYYWNIESLSNIPSDEMFLKWRNYLEKLGRKTTQKNGYDNGSISFIHQLYKFIVDLFDDRDEYEKDTWDCRKIPGAKITNSKTNYLLQFQDIPLCFRDMVKRYIKYRTTYNSQGQCQADIRSLRLFLNHIQRQEPHRKDLMDLTRQHMEEYLAWYAGYSKDWKSQHVSCIIDLRTFLEYSQRAQYPEAPDLPSVCLIFKEDIPKNPQRADEDIKYIPECVISQFEEHVNDIEPKQYQSVAIVLRASGWRISDVLELKYDTCLEHTSKGWYLHGDIPKVSVLNHRVPITDEVAAIIKAFSEETKKLSTTDNNPDRILFNCFRGKRKGKCYRGNGVQDAFNKMSRKCNIEDDQGQIFHFKNHAFRHTKGVELINNGMNLLHVQKWLAHASPEMTMRYARILDDTMRKSWEEAMKNGLFRIGNDGKAIPINPNNLIDEDLIEWEYIKNNLDAVRMPLGYCMKSKKQECHTQLNPCLTCRNLCTTIDFIPQYEQEIHEVKLLIETGKKLGRDVWAEKNEYLLQRYEEILTVLKEGRTHHKAGKKGREYIGDDRNVN